MASVCGTTNDWEAKRCRRNEDDLTADPHVYHLLRELFDYETLRITLFDGKTKARFRLADRGSSACTYSMDKVNDIAVQFKDEDC